MIITVNDNNYMEFHQNLKTHSIMTSQRQRIATTKQMKLDIISYQLD